MCVQLIMIKLEIYTQSREIDYKVNDCYILQPTSTKSQNIVNIESYKGIIKSKTGLVRSYFEPKEKLLVYCSS